MEEQVLGQVFGDHADWDGECDFKKASISILVSTLLGLLVRGVLTALCCTRRYGDHYEWNKVVTCIHNVLSQQRYLEHYGEVIIRNLKSSVCTCKITFVKVCFDFTFCNDVLMRSMLPVEL